MVRRPRDAYGTNMTSAAGLCHRASQQCAMRWPIARRLRTVQNEAMSEHPVTIMAKEAREAPERVKEQLDKDGGRLDFIAATLRQFRPRAVLTCARGSSDHAATYARYLIETRLRLLTSSVSPSVSSVYGVKQDLDRCLFLVLSQSGRSPDLLAA